MVSGALRTTVGRVKIEREVFRDPMREITVTVMLIVLFFHDHLFHASIYFIGGGIEHYGLLPGQPHPFQDIERTEGVYLKIASRICYRCRNGNLCRKVENDIKRVLFKDISYGLPIGNASFHKFKIGNILSLVTNILFRSFPGEIIQYDDLVTFRRKMLHYIRSDESGSAGYKYFHNILICLIFIYLEAG